MALDYSDKKLHRYFDALLHIDYTKNTEKELANLQKVMSADDYDELLRFGKFHQDVLAFVSRDVDEDDYASKHELQMLEDFEKFADEKPLRDEYKAKMYDYVLTGVEKFNPNSKHSLSLLEKIVENTPRNNRNELKHWREHALRYKYTSGNDYKRFIEKVSLILQGKDPKKIEEARERYHVITEELKQPHSTEERIELRKEQLELFEKYSDKRKIKTHEALMILYYNLANEYAAIRDEFNKTMAEAKMQDAQYSIRRIQNHTKNVR